MTLPRDRPAVAALAKRPILAGLLAYLALYLTNA